MTMMEIEKKKNSSPNGSKKNKNILQDIGKERDIVSTPGPFDVVFGRGHRCNELRGFYNELIERNWKSYYNNVTPREKAAFVKSRIIDMVFDAGGRFLEWEKEDGTWVVVNDEKMIVTRLSQKIRDMHKAAKRDEREELSTSSRSSGDVEMAEIGMESPNAANAENPTEKKRTTTPDALSSTQAMYFKPISDVPETNIPTISTAQCKLADQPPELQIITEQCSPIMNEPCSPLTEVEVRLFASPKHTRASARKPNTSRGEAELFEKSDFLRRLRNAEQHLRVLASVNTELLQQVRMLEGKLEYPTWPQSSSPSSGAHNGSN